MINDPSLPPEKILKELVQYSYHLIKKNNLKKAFGALDQALAIDPENVSALKALGTAYRKQGKLTKAWEAFDKAEKIEPNDVVIIIHKANIFLDIGRKDLAIKAYSRVIEIEPNNMIGLDRLANLYLDQNDLEKAENISRKAAINGVHNTQALITYANILIFQKKYTELSELCDQEQFGKAGIGCIYLFAKLAFMYEDQKACSEYCRIVLRNDVHMKTAALYIAANQDVSEDRTIYYLRNTLGNDRYQALQAAASDLIQDREQLKITHEVGLFFGEKVDPYSLKKLVGTLSAVRRPAQLDTLQT